MSVISSFFTGFFNFLDKLPSWQGITTLIIVLLIIILTPQIRKLSVWIFEKFVAKKRSCGDCILIIFGISEKYKTQIDQISRRILETQMNYAEQKIEMLILELLRTYKEQQNKKLETTDKKASSKELDKEYINYRECLLNAIELSRREVRRTFKENGFEDLSGKEFADYVKDKAKDLLAIARNYMMNSYFKDSYIQIEERFNSFDERAFEDLVFDVYIKAKEAKNTSVKKMVDLDQEFKNEIDNFITKK